jgi:hypothetical protein
MYQRLDPVSRELDRQGLELSSGYPSEPIKTLADVLEPATFGQRIRAHKYNQQTPLTGLVDMVRPESETAREFAVLVDRNDRSQMRVWLARWRNNEAGVAPAAETLRRLGEIGLQALDYLDRNERPPASWLAEQRAFLYTLKKPQNELRFAIVPSISKLVEVTASRP